VDINGKLSDEQTINISVLQGTTLGPILFLCYINDIFTATKLATFLFADDTSCLAMNKNLNELISFINTELQKLANWFRSNKMAVNVSKTKYIIFRTKGKQIPINTPPIIFNNNEIGKFNDPSQIFPLERVYLANPNKEHQTYKLLGVLFDEYLNFDTHCRYICAKLTRAIFCIKRASNLLSPKSLRSLYFALVHPHLLYCTNIISCTSKSNINHIHKLQKKAIRIITKSTPSSHTTPLFISNGILPFDKIIIQAKLTFMHGIFYNYAIKSFENVFPKNNTRDVNYELRNANDFIVPHARIELFKRFPPHSFPSEWNRIGDLRYQHNKVTFSIALKNHLFDLISNQ
jgi:hypothetical protein